MKTKVSPALFATLAASLTLLSTSVFSAERIYENPVPSGQNSAAIAAARNDWFAMVQGKFDKYSGRQADIVFDGDSITNRWETTGRSYWTKYFQGRSADFGIEGDRVENVLWRLEKGQLDGVNPKLVVIMIGTNNTGRNSAEEIADGIKAVVEAYKKRAPSAHIVLMSVFPRSEKAADGARRKVDTINQLIASLDHDAQVTIVDIGPKMMNSEGTISREMMPDFLHPTEAGYAIWADAILPLVEKYAPRR